mgnify:CR=1 FL=1
MVPGAQANVTVVVNNQEGVYSYPHYEGCCSDAMIHCSEGTALLLFILNILLPGFGTLISSCVDIKGCNCMAFFVSLCQGFLAQVIIGWIWSIVHGFNIYEFNKKHHSSYPSHHAPLIVSHHGGHHGGHH